jgi:hypothetical protein
MDEAQKLIEEVAHKPVQFWGAGLVLAAVWAYWIAIRRTIKTLSDHNKELMEMLREKDKHIEELNQKLVALLNGRRDRNG